MINFPRSAGARDQGPAQQPAGQDWRDDGSQAVVPAPGRCSRTSAQRLAAKTTLRTSVPDAAHTLWALTVPELYVLHVKESGRRPAAYQRWLADVLIAVLLAH